MRMIVTVAISNATRQFDKLYSYLVPADFEQKIMPGMRVMVPFGRANRFVEAYIFSLGQWDGKQELKEIKEIIDAVPLVDENMLKLCTWMRDRYICTYGDALKAMLPPGISIKNVRTVKLLNFDNNLTDNMKKALNLLAEKGGECEYNDFVEMLKENGIRNNIKALVKAGCISVQEEHSPAVREKYVRAVYLLKPVSEIIDEIESNRIRKIHQIRILEMLIESEYIPVPELKRLSGVSTAMLETLRKRGYIGYKDIEVKRDPFKDAEIMPTQPLMPTSQQKDVLDYLYQRIETGSFEEVLIHGVTGSGKTEVYMQLIQKALEYGRTAIVLVPEISLTPQMTGRFKGRFGDRVAVLHSRLSPGERYDQWRLIKEGNIKVVVGARSAIFAPLKNIGVIIIDEEHETSYKSETTPKYHAREIARQRCILDNGILVYGSATPSIETYYRAETGEIKLLVMNERTNRMDMPQVELVDMRNELDEGNRTMFSRKLAYEIKRNIELKQQTMLFLNRRGHSSFVMCRKCGLVLKCPNCSISLTYHSNDERLICHYCGFTVKNPEICPKCKSNYIKHFGTGTQKVEKEVLKYFPESTVIRMDMDTTTCKGAHEEILNRFKNENINIMIGTQMIAKGHDFHNVTLVGVLAADSLLNIGDYYSAERTFQLITQVAGRAGRGDLPGRVIIQTYNTDEYSIQSACKQDYELFYKQEIKIREKLEYPPFTNIAVIILSGAEDRKVFVKTKEICSYIRQAMENSEAYAEVLGPARAPLRIIKRKYRWRIIIKCRDINKIIEVLTAISDNYYKGKTNDGVEITMDINPVSML